MLEQALVCHCAPTLAKIKVGNLINVTYESREEIRRELDELSAQLEPKGVVLTVLRWTADHALLYLYRKAELRQHLADQATQNFLKLWGYRDFSVAGALDHLRSRLGQSDEFPHEIGVFLGYPLSDVVGFIVNGGKNCLCCGCWKVYSNECEAKRVFARYNKCREIYTRLFQSGYPLARLTVATRSIGFQN